MLLRAKEVRKERKKKKIKKKKIKKKDSCHSEQQLWSDARRQIKKGVSSGLPQQPLFLRPLTASPSLSHLSVLFYFFAHFVILFPLLFSFRLLFYLTFNFSSLFCLFFFICKRSFFHFRYARINIRILVLFESTEKKKGEKKDDKKGEKSYRQNMTAQTDTVKRLLRLSTLGTCKLGCTGWFCKKLSQLIRGAGLYTVQGGFVKVSFANLDSWQTLQFK